jgi:hypothetical protein
VSPDDSTSSFHMHAYSSQQPISAIRKKKVRRRFQNKVQDKK